MKADLVTREPERLEAGQTGRLYDRSRRPAPAAEVRPARRPALRQRRRAHRHGAEQDPQGHRRQVQDACGASARPTCPGWDCHGLPIEFKVTQEMRKARRHGRSRSRPTIRKACEAYARKYIDIQRDQFKRLGVLGDWDIPT